MNITPIGRDIIIALIGLITASVVAYKQIKEYKARHDLPGFKPNPERCKEHADRLTALEGREATFLQGLGEVKASIDSVGKNVDTLLKLHLKE